MGKGAWRARFGRQGGGYGTTLAEAVRREGQRVAGKFEYWTAVFGVGLDGLSDFDHDELNAIAAEGWEPFNMTAVHGGFAVVVMFRRETVTGVQAAAAAPVKKAVKKTPVKKAAAAKRAR